MTALINSLLLVVVGEMGDKTQLLAMAMAGRFKVRDVMSGVLLATILNHALAVLVGSYLGSFLPMNLIAITAGVSFVIFGLWTIRGDTEDGKNKKPGKLGPVLTVAIAFFIAEMGDKTQLMTLALAAQFRQPLWVLAGTTTGMLIADGIGVIFGAWICSHISQNTIKWAAGLIFIFFGSLNLYENAPAWLLNPLYASLYGLAVAGSIYLVGIKFARPRETLCDSIPLDAE